MSFDINFIQTRAKLQTPKSFICEDFLYAHHTDLHLFAKHIFKRFTSKDEACRKIANMYVPRKSDGYFCARIYKTQKVTDDQHYEMLQHNAVDLGVTLRLYDYLKGCDDFIEFNKPPEPEEPTGNFLADSSPSTTGDSIDTTKQ
jgi:hypothetical protein